MELTTLQELINRRATAKLNEELDKLYATLQKSRLMGREDTPKLTYNYKRHTSGNLTSSVAAVVDAQSVEMPHSHFRSGAIYRKVLFDTFYPTYVKEETDAFLKGHDQLIEKVNSLQNELDDLRNQQTD